MIERFEGKRNHAYPDPISGGAPWTCGIGCTGPDIGPGTYWTDAEIDQHFADRLAHEFEPAVNKEVEGVPTTQGQFDALASLAYNIGAAGEARSTVIELHRQGKYDEAADAFLRYDHAQGREIDALAARRAEEGQLYLDSSPASDDAGDASPASAPAAAPAPSGILETVTGLVNRVL